MIFFHLRFSFTLGLSIYYNVSVLVATSIHQNNRYQVYRLWRLTSFSSSSPPCDPHSVTSWKIMLGSRQADGSDVVRVGDRTVQLHQGNVIVISVWVVVWVGYDLLQVPLYHGASSLLLGVKAEESFPSARLRESDDTHQKQIAVQLILRHNMWHQHHIRKHENSELSLSSGLVYSYGRVCDDSHCIQSKMKV